LAEQEEEDDQGQASDSNLFPALNPRLFAPFLCGLGGLCVKTPDQPHTKAAKTAKKGRKT
jgi:hypothetical protein